MSALDAHRAAVDLCTYCPKLCRWACPVAEAECRETSTPWAMMTRVDDVMTGRAPLDAEAAEVVAHCTGCGRCQTACKHGNDVAGVLQVARAEARAAGVAPTAQLGWAQEAPPASAAWDALPTAGPVRLLAGYADDAVIRAALRLLAAAGITGVGRPAGGARHSGVRFREVGATAEADAALTTLRAAVTGAERLVCLDAADAVALRAAWHGGPAVVHLTEALVARLPPLRPRATGDVLYLDACRLGRGLGQYDGPREILARAIDGQVEEATMARREAGCCGAGAAYAAVFPAGGAAVAREAAADRPGIPVVIAEGPCAAHLRAALAPRPVWHWAEVIAAALPEGAA